MANQPKRFKAMLERGTEGRGWTIARLPFNPHEASTNMQRLRARQGLGSEGARNRVPYLSVSRAA
jgi:hypothetical protein